MPGLDDPAAYQGYQTRLFKDAAGNTLQVYLDRREGRVVHILADAENASIGFSARAADGSPAALEWGESGARVARAQSNGIPDRDIGVEVIADDEGPTMARPGARDVSMQRSAPGPVNSECELREGGPVPRDVGDRGVARRGLGTARIPRAERAAGCNTSPPRQVPEAGQVYLPDAAT